MPLSDGGAVTLEELREYYLFDKTKVIAGIIWCEDCEVWASLDEWVWTEYIYCELCSWHTGIRHKGGMPDCFLSYDWIFDKVRLK